MGDARSGAGVHRVRTPDGTEAYRKVSPPGLAEVARRELAFYREVAPTLDCRTPALLDAHESPDGVTLLLASAGEHVPVHAWTDDMWAALGGELARLHTAPLPPGALWRRPDALAAVGVRLVGRAVLTHGDCHTGNVVFRDGRPTLCDWASAVIGRAASDLAFLNVRAAPEGITAPPALLTAYVRRTGDDRAELQHRIDAEELAVYRHLWPPYAAFNTPEGVARVRRRTEFLAARV